MLAVVFMLGLGGIVVAWTVYTNPATVTLGAAGNFAVLAGTGITSTAPPQFITGDAGSEPTPANGLVQATDFVSGTNYPASTAPNADVAAAKVALKAAYTDISTRSPDFSFGPIYDLGGSTLGPGIYNGSSSLAITGTLTLDGGSNPNAIFIFQAGSTLITATSSIVSLINGAQACNVYWQVGSDATLGTTSNFSGTIMAKTSITDDNGSTVNGRLLADADNDTTGAVTLHSTHLTVPKCAPSLLLQKAVAGGGADDPSAWTLKADGAGGSPTNLSGITGATGADSDLQFPNATFKADTYTLTETGPSTDYATTYSCANVNNGVTTTTTSSSITLVAGDKAICTITNTYTAPSTTTLKLVKAVTNNNGGTTLNTAWTLTATGAGGFSDNGGTGIFHTVTAGVGYVLSESAVAGYTAGTWSCNGGSLSGSTITLSSGQNITCTINNDDIAPQLHLLKIINGIPADYTLFTLTANGTGSNDISGTSPVNSGVGLLADTFALSENSVANYSSSLWSCVGGTQVGSNITLGINEEATCTVTNTYTAPSGGGGSSRSTPPIPPLIDVVKVPSPLALPLGPGPVTYTYTLRNTGTVPVTDITMVDDTCSPIGLVSGDINEDSKLDVSEVWTYNCFTTLSETHTNIVTATGWANGINAIDIASATVVVGIPIVPPLIHVTKIPSPLALSALGGIVTYTNKVTNPGIVALSNVRLTDNKCGPVKYASGDTNGDSKLDVLETWTYTCQANLTKTTTNTVIAEGDANGLTARDFAIATVVVSLVPSLPNTGFPPQENNNLIVLVSMFATLVIFYLIPKKQIA